MADQPEKPTPSPVATWKRRARIVLKTLAILAAPIFLAQTLGFVSFIYEESLQASGFAARAAIDARDVTIALDCVRSFKDLVYRAQAFQRRYGCLAFWSNGAYETYFYVAAPHQLLAMHAAGKKAGLWQDPVGRWTYTTDQHGVRIADNWKNDPVAYVADYAPLVDPRPRDPDPLDELRRQSRTTITPRGNADETVNP